MLGGNDTFTDACGDDLICLGEGNDQMGADFSFVTGADTVDAAAQRCVNVPFWPTGVAQRRLRP